MKQVPEEMQKSVKQQLEILRGILIGDSDFAACRGGFNDSLQKIVAKLVNESGSVTAFAKNWDKYLGSVRKMAITIAQLARDGHKIAREQLETALGDRHYKFPGETLPLESTDDYTILMLEPEKTMMMARWLTSLTWDEKQGLFQWPYEIEKLTESNRMLFSVFRNLHHYIRHPHSHRNEAFALSYEETVLSSFPASIQNFLERVRNPWTRESTGGTQLELRVVHYLSNEAILAYAFKAQQSDVLKLFSRDDQKRIATWQVRVPKALDIFYVGLYPESLHEKCKEVNADLVSKGFTYGMGAMVMTKFPVAIPGFPYEKVCTTDYGIPRDIVFAGLPIKQTA